MNHEDTLKAYLDDQLHYLALRHANEVRHAQGHPQLLNEIVQAIKKAVEEDRRKSHGR